ncbi:MAG TPA: hypothetical protein DCO77_13135 [Nitrospiraceae bacterium]|nr:hypothetical protein [Nitrospiraceae bacterium]
MPEEMDEIEEVEERLKHLKAEQLQKLMASISENADLTAKQRQEMKDLSLLLKEDIKRSEEAADRLLKEKGNDIIKLMDELSKDNTFSEEHREEFVRVAAMVAGYLLSSWLPDGLTRRILMFLLFIVGIIGVIKWSWFGLLILFAAMFSPRIVEETANFIGKLTGYQRD